MDIHDTLQEAIAQVEAGRSRAFGAGVVVDRDRMLQLLNHARQSLPEEILAAASIIAPRTPLTTETPRFEEALGTDSSSTWESPKADGRCHEDTS